MIIDKLKNLKQESEISGRSVVYPSMLIADLDDVISTYFQFEVSKKSHDLCLKRIEQLEKDISNLGNRIGFPSAIMAE